METLVRLMGVGALLMMGGGIFFQLATSYRAGLLAWLVMVLVLNSYHDGLRGGLYALGLVLAMGYLMTVVIQSLRTKHLQPLSLRQAGLTLWNLVPTSQQR